MFAAHYLSNWPDRLNRYAHYYPIGTAKEDSVKINGTMRVGVKSQNEV